MHEVSFQAVPRAIPPELGDLAYELSIDRLLPAIGARVKAVIDGDAAIVLVNDIHVGAGLAGVCAETRRGLLVENDRAMAHPLVIRGELLGVITVRRSADAPPFTASDLTRLESFADHAALALRNATLYREAEQRRRAAEELARMARGLSRRQDTRSRSPRRSCAAYWRCSTSTRASFVV